MKQSCFVMQKLLCNIGVSNVHSHLAVQIIEQIGSGLAQVAVHDKPQSFHSKLFSHFLQYASS